MKIYKQIWRYLKECRTYFLIVSIIFLASLLIGYVFPVFFVDLIQELLKKLAGEAAGLGFFQLLVFILENNIMTAFVGMVFGILLVFPVLIVLLNGYVLGFVMNKTSEVAGSLVLFRLLPHGVFELPALIISLGLGLRIGMFIFHKNKKKDLKYALENSLRVFLFVVIPLLVVAGFIEAWLIVFLG